MLEFGFKVQSMKMVVLGIAVLASISGSAALAEDTVIVDGQEYPLSLLTQNCQSMSEEPQAMIACFNALSQLIEDQSAGTQDNSASVAQALDNLRAVAQYQDDETGLLIDGTDCQIQFTYFGNYYHLSRRNVSTLDLFNVEFDPSQLQLDQVSEVPGAQVPLLSATMVSGATARSLGGIGLDSSVDGFDPKPARLTVGEYANELIPQLAHTDSQAFEFVLIHPRQNQASEQIWRAFETYVNMCR